MDKCIIIIPINYGFMGINTGKTDSRIDVFFVHQAKYVLTLRSKYSTYCTGTNSVSINMHSPY